MQLNQVFNILLFYFLSYSVIGQEEIVVNGFHFQTDSEVIENEWQTKDTVKKLYRLEEGKLIYVLSFYPYKDEGGDCNNLFWNKESLKVEGNHFVFLTHYFQKTGLDPIPEFREQIYEVDKFGKLKMTSEKYKYYNSKEWLAE